MGTKRRYNNNNNYTPNNRGRLSDRDMMLDLLNMEKHLSHLYEHDIMESSNITVHNAMEEFQQDEHENAYTLFSVMQEKGWYNPVEQEQRLQSKKTFHVKSKKRKYQDDNHNYYGYHSKSHNNEYPYA